MTADTEKLAREARERVDYHRSTATTARKHGFYIEAEEAERDADLLTRLAAALDGAPAQGGESAGLDLHRFGYAPGDYTSVCNVCRRWFSADKRAWRCRSCASIAAAQDAAKAQSAPAAPDTAGLVEERRLNALEAGADAMDKALLANRNGTGDYSSEQVVEDVIAAYTAALPAPTPAPEPGDWVRVPKQPTEEMIEAGWIDKEDVSPAEIYHAMLAAAPSQPAQDAGLIERATMAIAELHRVAAIGRRYGMKGGIGPENCENISAIIRDLLAALKAAPIPVESRP